MENPSNLVRESTRVKLGLLTEDELAEALRVQATTLEKWRGQGYGPTWVKLGNRVFYRVIDVRTWVNSEEVTFAKNNISEFPTAA